MKYQKGLTLIELLMGLSLSAFSMVILLHLYSGIKTSYRMHMQRMHDQLDLSLLATVLREKIRPAGYTPCRNLESLISFDTRKNKADLSAIVMGKSSLTLHRMDANYQIAEMGATINQLLVPSHESSKGIAGPVIIADCFHAEVHSLKRVQRSKNHTLLLLDKSLMFHYEPPVYVGNWLEERFFMSAGKKGFFYQRKRADVLTDSIQSFATAFKQHGSMVHIVLGTASRHLTLATRIRSL